jgi:methyltransferase (TIGR00027 family)
MAENNYYNALVNGYYRSYHSQFDNSKIFDDYLAYQFLTEEEYAGFNNHFLMAFKSGASALGSSFPNDKTALAWIIQHWSPLSLVVSRSRYAEDMLEEAIKMGVKQYVILGAGMDTFAFRRKDLLGTIKVFEVDHPQTQDLKRSRLDKLCVELPKELHFVPLDFKSDNFATLMNNSNYSLDEITFYSLLGVTPYLTQEEFFSTLRSIKELSMSGSEIVFDYCDKNALLIKEGSLNRAQAGIMSIKEAGKHNITAFDSSNLSEEIYSIGYSLCEHLSPLDIENRYFKNRNDSYHAYENAYFACARVE